MESGSCTTSATYINSLTVAAKIEVPPKVEIMIWRASTYVESGQGNGFTTVLASCRKIASFSYLEKFIASAYRVFCFFFLSFSRDHNQVLRQYCFLSLMSGRSTDQRMHRRNAVLCLPRVSGINHSRLLNDEVNEWIRGK